MGKSPSGLKIDRIDNDGNYEPGNCRWTTHEEQMNNRSVNRILLFNGRKQTLAQWAKESGICLKRIHSRLKRGWTVERAITEPVKVQREGAISNKAANKAATERKQNKVIK